MHRYFNKIQFEIDRARQAFSILPLRSFFRPKYISVWSIVKQNYREGRGRGIVVYSKNRNGEIIFGHVGEIRPTTRPMLPDDATEKLGNIADGSSTSKRNFSTGRAFLRFSNWSSPPGITPLLHPTPRRRNSFILLPPLDHPTVRLFMTRFVWLLAVYTRSSIELLTATRYLDNKTLPPRVPPVNPFCMTACPCIFFLFLSFFSPPNASDRRNWFYRIHDRSHGYSFSWTLSSTGTPPRSGVLYTVVEVSNFSCSMELSWLPAKTILCASFRPPNAAWFDVSRQIISTLISWLKSWNALADVDFVNFYCRVDRLWNFERFGYIRRF